MLSAITYKQSQEIPGKLQEMEKMEMFMREASYVRLKVQNTGSGDS